MAFLTVYKRTIRLTGRWQWWLRSQKRRLSGLGDEARQSSARRTSQRSQDLPNLLLLHQLTKCRAPLEVVDFENCHLNYIYNICKYYFYQMYPKLFIYQIIGYLIIKLIVQKMQAERASSNSNRLAAKCFQRRNWPVRGATYATEAQ